MPGMTEPDAGRDTRVVDVKGRSLVIGQLTDAQMMLMLRESKLLQREDVAVDRKLTGIARVFDILESAVVQQVDRDYLIELMVAGSLEMKDLFGFLNAFNEEADKPKVRRGRPPRVRT